MGDFSVTQTLEPGERLPDARTGECALQADQCYKTTLEMSGFRTLGMSLIAGGLANKKLSGDKDDANNHDPKRTIPTPSY